MDTKPGGDGGAASSNGKGAGKDTPQTNEFEETGFCGYLALDQIAEGKWVVTHTTTMEKVTLDGFVVELVESPEIGAVVVLVLQNEEDWECKQASELFKITLWKHKDTQKLHVHLGGNAERLTCWQTYISRHRKARINMRLTSSSASVDMTAFLFRTPRAPRQSVFWALSCIYDLLGMTSFKKTPSKWAWNLEHRWRPHFEKYFGITQFCLGSYINDDTAAKNSLPPAARCLPAPAVSTVGLLTLLCSWSYLPRQRGGVEDPHVRQHSQNFLARLVKTALSQLTEPRRVEIVGDNDFMPSWPRPRCLQKRGQVEVMLSTNGILFLGPLFDFVWRNPRSRVLKSWLSEFRPICEVSMQIDLLDFLQVALSRNLRALFSQVVILVSWFVEHAMGLIAQGKVPEDKPVEGVEVNYCAPDEALDPAARDHLLLEYVQASKHAAKGIQYVHMATDKGHSGSLPMQFSMISLGNIGIVACPQVDRAAFCEENYNLPGVAINGARASSSADGPERLDRSARHKAWVTRYTGGVRDGSHRPVQLHRKGAKRWVLLTDNQLAVMLGTFPKGWAFFKPDSSMEKWRHWSTWPWIGVARDLGSDGLAATMALTYGHGLNLTPFDDYSHGANCDLKVCLRGAGLWQFYLLMFVSFNLPYGVENDEVRRMQIRESMELVFKRENSNTCVLFKAYSCEMLEEWRRSGKDLPGLKSPEEELWDALAQRSPFANPGYRKASMCRFQDMVTAAECNFQTWHLDLWERVTLALDMDWLRGKAFAARVTSRATDTQDAGENSGSTNPKRIKVEDRTLRSVAHNCVSISVAMLAEESNRRIVGIFLSVAKVVKKWHQEQNKVLRSAASSKGWLLGQIAKAEYIGHISEVATQLRSAGVLEECGFIVEVGAAQSLSNGDLVDEDFFADLLGQVSLHMMSARCRRGLWLVSGWPMRMTAVLQGGAIATQTVEAFKKDLAIYAKFKEQAGTSAKERNLLKRHCLQLTANQQLAQAFEESRFQITEPIKKMIRMRSEGVTSSQVCEDMIGAAKNDPSTKLARRFRKPETAMANVLAKSIIQERHDFKPLDTDTHSAQLAEKLSPDCFRPTASSSSFDYSNIMSTSQAAPWYSPSATNVNTPFADLQLLRDLDRAGSFLGVREASLGCVMQVEHRIAFCERAPSSRAASGEQWYIAMWHWPDSAVLAWPAKRYLLPQSRDAYLVVEENIKQPTLKSITSYDNIVASEITWRSWVWQYNNYPAWRSSLPLSVKPFLGKEMKVLELAASKAFWHMPKSEIVDVTKRSGFAFGDTSSLYEVLSQAVSKILKCDEENTLKVLSLRLSDSEVCNEYTEALLNIDSAVEVLDDQDKEAVDQEMQSAKSRLEAREEYRKSYHEQYKLFRLAKETKAKRAKRSPTVKEALPVKIEQKEAAKYIPPNTSIWVGRRNGSWQGHCKPFARLYESWRKSSEEEACRRVIRGLWDQYLMLNGMERSDCPWTNMFDDSA